LESGNLPDKFTECAKALFDISEDLVFILDSLGRIVEINQRGAISLDYDPDELKGKTLLELVNDNDKSRIAGVFSTIIKDKKSFELNVTFNSKLNHELIYQLDIKPVFKDGVISGVVGAGKNITLKSKYENSIIEYKNKLIETERLLDIERSRDKEKESVLEELNKLKNDFISNISHELRTPLASIIGFSETIMSDPEMPEEMKSEFNNIILSEGKRLAKLINDILDISKFEVGRLVLNKSNFDIIPLIKEVVEINRNSIPAGKLTFNVSLPNEKTMIYGDKDRILQAVNGLINNAVKYTDKGGIITIIGNNLLNEFEFIVSDTGIGIPEEDIPFVFQKFYKVSRPGREVPGVGLELTFVKQIIDLHKGMITVRSEVNKGTTFKVKLARITNY
jgi:PAS domain S-box-containing protein